MTSLCTTFPSFNIILILLYFILITFNLSFSVTLYRGSTFVLASLEKKQEANVKLTPPHGI